MTFEVTFNFPAQNNGIFPGKTSNYGGYDLESAVYDLIAEGWGSYDDQPYPFREGLRFALTAVLEGLPVGAPLTITGDTHRGYYAEPVTMTVTRTE